MLDYGALGLPAWTLFACLRTVMWANTSGYDVKSDIALCDLTKQAALLKYCGTERELDWSGFIQNHAEFNYANAPKEEQENIKNRLAKGSQSRQWACIHGK